MPLKIDEQIKEILGNLKDSILGSGLTGHDPDGIEATTEAKEKIKQLIDEAKIEELEKLLEPTWTAEQWQSRIEDKMRNRIKQLTENSSSR